LLCGGHKDALHTPPVSLERYHQSRCKRHRLGGVKRRLKGMHGTVRLLFELHIIFDLLASDAHKKSRTAHVCQQLHVGQPCLAPHGT
jgi:hypothetical protein